MTNSSIARLSLIAVLGLGVPPVVGAETFTLPQFASDLHLGVVTCASSTCHGSLETWKDSTVVQNEYIIWSRKDKHAKAYEVLSNDKSKRMARNLGLESARTAKICLDCHADNVGEAQRGKRFQLSDGVGCEACHGGAIRWLGPHVSGKGSHKENIELGMYPTEDPVQRARLCLSCHYGNADKFVTHRILGAGHPRLSFELDTFTAIQPRHFVVDKDYRERKTVWSGVQVWAIGQAIAVQQTLESLVNPKLARAGIFPELAFFDCHACHQPMSQKRWTPRVGTQLGPGVVRLNDAHLLMLRHLTLRIDPSLATLMRQKAIALHRAASTGEGSIVEIAGELRGATDKVIAALAQHVFTPQDVEALLQSIVQEGIAGEYLDYAAAEQATMAIAAIVTAQNDVGALNKTQIGQLDSAVKQLYAIVESDEKYQSHQFMVALKQFSTVAGQAATHRVTSPPRHPW